MTTRLKRMHNAIYRARKKGSDIITRNRTIYQPYGTNTPPCRQESILLAEYDFGIQLKIT